MAGGVGGQERLALGDVRGEFGEDVLDLLERLEGAAGIVGRGRERLERDVDHGADRAEGPAGGREHVAERQRRFERAALGPAHRRRGPEEDPAARHGGAQAGHELDAHAPRTLAIEQARDVNGEHKVPVTF